MKFADVFLLPNLITLSRFFLSLYLFFNYSTEDLNSYVLILIIAVIGLSDSLDGIVARKFNLVSKLGIILDPFTDRVVFIILLIWLSSLIPINLIYAVLIREFLVLLGSIYVLKTGAKINVSKKGKFGTVALFVLLCLFVLNTTIFLPYLDQLAFVVIIFYFYVAIEYLYNLIYKSG
ncbi:MAG: CDP-alcohol phosphatidyltransferase family protein [Proteobacteria bacterium]|nr:CDP-alcohol phosphatidyltransferase family protein [Pseudomonadota bacterium]